MTIFGAFRTMWVIAMFDLPTETEADKRAYTKFRKALLKDGFIMMQYSVYMRHCASEENANVHAKRIESVLPARGEVRTMQITDKQFSRIKVFRGKRYKPVEQAPQQITLL